MIPRFTGLFALLLLSQLLVLSPAIAYTVTEIGPATGGNPGDLCAIEGGTTCQPYYAVSELVAGDSLDMNWALDGSQILGLDLVADLPTLHGYATLTVSSITASTLVLDITLNNNTDLLANVAGLTASIVSFGMELDGFASGSLTTAGSSLDFYGSNNLAGGLGLSTDFCSSTDRNCNKGKESDGIAIGGSDTIQFTLAGVFDPILGVTLSNFAAKWQTNYDTLVTADDPDVIAAGGNSGFELAGSPTGVAPEPGTAVLLGLGLVGLSARARRAR